ncbi:SRPBCC family protein [Streptomyces sp. RK9]|uniref:SRPBCC family protein n=1 Tax=Streptomyces sp. RK9 TaxID=3239284 RepID=UPI00386A056B
MTDTREQTREDTEATENGGRSKAPNMLRSAANSPAADRLKDEAKAYAMAQAERALIGVGRKLGETTVKLNDIADGRSPGFGKLALEGGRKLAQGKGPLRGALELGGSHLKDSVKGAVKNLTGRRKKGGGGQKPTVILEYVDVGVPVREAYDQWTQFQEFSTYAKGVKSASAAGDTDSDWQLKIFLSSRSWKAHVTEQVPDQRISWTSEGAKGTTKGVVTFHPLGEQLTRVLLVVEYYPKGLFEKTGNIWRAQGRRVRLDLKHFARHISMRGEASDGWRGEIRDGEVVRGHEEAVADEEGADDEGAYEDGDRDDQDDQDDQDGYEGAYEDEDDEEGAYEEADEDALAEEEGEGTEEEDEAEGRADVDPEAADDGEDVADEDADDELVAADGGRNRR